VLSNFIHIVHLVALYLYNCNKWSGELDKVKIDGKTYLLCSKCNCHLKNLLLSTAVGTGNRLIVTNYYMKGGFSGGIP